MNGVRYLFCGMCFLILVVNFAIRVNLNVAIVAMVNSSAVYNIKNKTISQDCPAPLETFHYENDDRNSQKGEFVWSPKTQGLILGSYYYGYFSFQIAGGRLSEIYSGKWVITIGCFIASLLAILTPTAAHYSVSALVFVRAFQGVCQGIIFPALYTMASHWFPSSELGMFSAFIHSGSNIGIVLGLAGTGFLCSSDIFKGWPSAFYVFGITNCLITIIWATVVTNSPINHPLMTQKELKYIKSDQESEMNKYLPPIPWKKLFTSKAVWALLITSVGIDWTFYVLLNELPTFFATVLHVNIKENGFYSSMPFLLKSVLSLIIGFCTDILIRRRFASVEVIRKSCTSIACIGMACGLLGVCLAGCNVTVSATCLIVLIPLVTFCFSGHVITHLSLSPEYAGTLMGITNSVSSLAGISAPMFVGYITNEHQGLKEWHTIFGIAMALIIIACFTFITWGTTKRQDWIDSDTERTALVETETSFTKLT